MAAPSVSDGAASSRPSAAVRQEVAAEAAVWVTRLHGPSRSPAMERECLAWQARSAEHREAFERCTETWQAVPAVTLDHAYAGAAGARASVGEVRVLPWRWAAALGLAVVLVGGGLWLQQWQAQGVYETGVGEQQLVLLQDGTRMSLNTGTRVHVELDAGRRVVEVGGGEALFEVARDPQRPFVVRVAGSEVEALGTTFAVRYTADGAASAARVLAVTLIEGRVAVRHVPAAAAGAASAPPVLMQAGERVQMAMPASSGPAAPKVDHPNVASLLAWKRSEAVFDDAVLADAVAEMNRYSRTPIVLLDAPALAGLRVSGLYRTGDIDGFARAVAALHGLALRQGPGRLELAKPH